MSLVTSVINCRFQLGSYTPHRTDPAWAEHLARARVLEAEHGRVCARIRHLNDALARAAARWAVDQAAALGASVIYLEDLTTLQARGHRKGNARLSGQVRGTLAQAVRHLGAKAGITVVTVPARGTSRLCPGCLAVLTHHPAPDRLSERGWKWAHCTGCGLSMDRDHAAARRIVSRGLLAQTHTTTDRTTGARTIRTTVDGTVALVRRPKKTTRRLRRQRHTDQAPPRARGPKTTPRKGHPTPGRPSSTRHRSTRPATQALAPNPETSRRMPDVRTVPATTPTPGAAQRPAGHDTTTPATVRPVPGHGVPAPHRTGEDLPRTGRMRLSRRTCRRRTRAAERTGFHHLHATEVHPLTPRIGPPDSDRTRPRRARKAWKPQAHTEF
ncbi:zinc ribbon domain-containing protein [Streptomyces sp. MB09-02B]|uniref:zinc ribbon domain-containing protein n=1 Tax=Streptomyces sp. MB09-02B TaxID=3028667 RepID=UPI0029BA54B6|nr:zinc ribbon domain-containing protein [Streptomyces sp. MB09-02B]MDX3643764.1 zinc ribbon domain-containing protein [Streptomyces sp. MB09-02B]